MRTAGDLTLGITGDGRHSRDLDLVNLKLLFCKPYPEGIEIKDRYLNRKIHRNCWVGSEAVDWVLAHVHTTRQSAKAVLQTWYAQGDFKHVSESMNVFIDNSIVFYRNTS